MLVDTSPTPPPPATSTTPAAPQPPQIPAHLKKPNAQTQALINQRVRQEFEKSLSMPAGYVFAIGSSGVAADTTIEALERELEPLRFVHAAELEREIIEGDHHSGLGSVVQLVASKSA